VLKSKLLSHRQETPYSCVPACLRVVLLSLGHDIEESRLRALCDCTVFGTNAVQAIPALRELGFRRTQKHTLRLDELSAEVTRGVLPIAFVSTLLIDGVKGEHALIVLGISVTEVTVYDPLRGERILPLGSFEAAWAIMHNLTILVRP
jgi:ABC-type bacteriocin/lantibiotic exporter with double-glycine peptidase domain